MGTLGKLWKETSIVRQTPKTGIIVAGDFCIDADAHLATVRGHTLRLSSAEFEVLLYLISHKRSMVTPRTMLRTTAAEVSEAQGRTEFLHTLVSLRQKLEDAVPGARYVQTEAWILYDFHPGT